MSALLFIVFTLAVFTVPLIPAIHEFLTKTDVAPLPVPVGYDIDPRRFAYNFKAMVYDAASAYLDDGQPIKAGNVERTFKIYDPDDAASQDVHARDILVSRSSVLIPRGTWIHSEIYSRGQVRCRTASHVRAVFSERALVLGASVAVMRWAHGQVVHAQDRNELYGRITAESMIHVRNRAVFERLYAPVIRFGDRHGPTRFGRHLPERVSLDASTCGRLLFNQPELRRTVLEGDVVIPANTLIDTNLVVRGNLRIGDNVRIVGSVKSRGNMFIGHDCEITGSAVAQHSLLVGRRSQVLGPAIGERRIVLGNDSMIGSAQSLVTVTSERIDIHSGVIVFGSIWAREFGRAVGRSSVRSRS